MTEIVQSVVDMDKERVLMQIETAMKVNFSEDQRKVIFHTGSPLNVMSCAGSGKTTVSVAKMLFMEMYYDVSPTKILAMTFNREAIEEMEDRYFKARRRLDLNMRKKITFKTYHSLYYLILNSDYTDHSWNQVVDYSRYAFKLRDVCKKAFSKVEDDTLDKVMSIRGYQVNNLLSDTEILSTTKFITSGIDPNGYLQVIAKYEEFKKDEGNIDFDDLQVLMHSEMTARDDEGNLVNPEILKVIHNAWDYFIVDEYQDISKVQLNILKEMVKDHNKLTAIGDDDQSIYEFRGSKTEYIIDFGIHFMGADRLIMGTNYRVPENILMPITKSIENNKSRVVKQMTAYNPGGDLEYIMTTGSVNSALSIVASIEREISEGTPPEEIMILVRNNSQQRLVLDALLEKDIPVSTKSGYMLTNHFILKDLDNIIKLAMDDTDADMFKAVFNKITEFVKRQLISDIADKMKSRGGSWREYALNYTNKSIHEASSVLATVKSLVNKGASFTKIVETIQPLYREHLKFMVNKFGYDKHEFGDILGYIKAISEELTYDGFYKNCKRKESLKRFFGDNPSDAVRISTMHSMKGMEYEVVYLLDLTESILPNVRIESEIRETHGEYEADQYIEQERRLFYVAWTRAKRVLHVLVPVENPSRFIVETIQGMRKIK